MLIDAVPKGFYLHRYDDCGIIGRQPHVQMDKGAYCWTFTPWDTNAGVRERSAVFSYEEINMYYEDLDPDLSYVLVVTYANDRVYRRVQSLEANSVELHGPYTIPNGKAVRLVVQVPRSVTQDAEMSLRFRLHGEANVTVSEVELWADAPPLSGSLGIDSVFALCSDLTGRVIDLKYEGVSGATVRLSGTDDRSLLAETQTQSDGWFSFDRDVFEYIEPKGDLVITASYQGTQAKTQVKSDDLTFAWTRYRPIPTWVTGLASVQMSLDGKWRIGDAPFEDAYFRSLPLDSEMWKDISIPGQWVQQGFDFSVEQKVAMAREFCVPKEWSSYRIFLRFDSIHAGTDYWLNGHYLGHSERLYTPVEWEITDVICPGAECRLDLEMIVDTVSERLSYASGYAFHNLGGIDRSVKVYALPPVHIRDLFLTIELDKAYKDASLEVALTLDNCHEKDVSGMTIGVSILDPDGESVEHSVPELGIETLFTGQTTVAIKTCVCNPRKWNAEEPYLYKLVLDLTRDGELIQRVERNVGFRKIEIKGSQFYVNGQRVKLAGACHHEIDPLTGRADTMKYARGDLELMKGANLNYIRTSHYPPPVELLDAADELGLYVEAEAPFCWVRETDGVENLREVLDVTGAMIDYCHTHPSVVIWSLANESAFNRVFEVSNRLCKQLDPSRPTTFNNPDPKQICDIANVHYPGMPYDNVYPDDPRPLLLGEYFFPICHEQTDVHINPGLRELWGHGHAEPDSDWGKAVAESFKMPHLKPGLPPGTWSYMFESERVIGGVIWALIDEPFYLPDGKNVGYAWVHGFWGIIDGWRRPKPEWWLSKLIFAPIWFPKRYVDYEDGQELITIPVENRYSFTDLSELNVEWELDGQKVYMEKSLPPLSTGELCIAIPKGTPEGSKLILRVTDCRDELINVVAIKLGREKRPTLPLPVDGPSEWDADGDKIVMSGKGFALVFDRATGDFAACDNRHKAPLIKFPAFHVTRYDFGDLAGPKALPYAELPDAETRVINDVVVKDGASGLEVTVHDQYHAFVGSTSLLIDRSGMATVSYDYTYSGPDLNCREIGIKALLESSYDTLNWRRWSEWDIFPDDHISRTEGTAKARRKECPDAPESMRPKWPWYLDQTELGTNDFRSSKFSIYEASLVDSNGTGVRVHGQGDIHFRSCLSEHGVKMYVLSSCRLGQIVIRDGDRLKGTYVMEVVSS